MCNREMQEKNEFAIRNSEGGGPDFLKLLDQYNDFALAKGLALSTVKAVRHDVAKLSKWMAEQKIPDLSNLGPKQLQAFQVWLSKHPFPKGRNQKSSLSVASRAKSIANIRSFLKWAFRAEITPSDLSKHLIIPRTPKPLPRDIPTLQQIAKLIRSQPRRRDRTGIPSRNAALISTLFACGLRRQECADLKLDDIDLVNREVRVVMSKNGKGRTVPMVAWARDLLAHYLSDGRPRLENEESVGAVFLRANGKPINADDVDSILREASQKAKLTPKVQPHALRHAFCLHLLKGGASIRVVQCLAGHKKLSITSRYTKLTTLDLARVMKKSHPRGK